MVLYSDQEKKLSMIIWEFIDNIRLKTHQWLYQAPQGLAKTQNFVGQ